jgi:sarcosine oxidase delta subunit
VIVVVGDTTNLWVNNTDNYLRIPSELYGPPTNVVATRNGDQVTITWDSVYMTVDDDRGYFIEAWVCQDGAYIWWTVGEGTLVDQYRTTYTVKDQAGCSMPSSGKLFTVEKHGYSSPVDIPWPAP